MSLSQNKIKNFISHLDFIDLTIFAIIISSICYVIANILSNGTILGSRVYDHYRDHLIHLYGMTDKSNYPNGYMLFPPFAYIIYGLMLQSDISRSSENLFKEILDLYNTLPISFYTYHIYFMCSILIFICVFVIIYKIINIKQETKRLVFVSCITLSYPILLPFVIGNSVLLTFLYVLAGAYLITSENKILNFIGLLCIAIASNLKFYPAFFGLILIKRKDFKNALLLIILGILIFVLSAYYFDGPATLNKIITTITGFGNTGNFVKTNIYGITNQICDKIFHIEINDNLLVLNSIRLFLFVASISGFTLAKKYWQELFFIGFICTFCFTNAYTYNFIFTLPAVIYFFKEENTLINKISINTLYFLLIIMFLHNSNSGVIHIIPMYIFFAVLLLDVINSRFNRVKS